MFGLQLLGATILLATVVNASSTDTSAVRRRAATGAVTSGSTLSAIGHKIDVLYAFTGGADGGEPLGNPFAEHGAGYGTTAFGGSGGVCFGFGCGTVFKLTPPAAGKPAWTESVIHTFTGTDGGIPVAGVIADEEGALYGTTGQFAGGSGTVFKLTPPAPGQAEWTESVLYDFAQPGDGASPIGGLIRDRSGALYGTTSTGGAQGQGTVYKLTPPLTSKAAWTENVLYSFPLFQFAEGEVPSGKLIMDASGALYGTTSAGGLGGNCFGGGCGTVFKLTPPAPGKTGWTHSAIHFFTGADGADPTAGLIADRVGALYTTTRQGGIPHCSGDLGCGTVVKLTPPVHGSTAWTETVLHFFTGPPNDGARPYADLIGDRSGALYGTTDRGGAQNSGTVFKMTPPAPGTTAWTESVYHSFTFGADGCNPDGALLEVGGAVYGTTSSCGADNWGTIFKLKL